MKHDHLMFFGNRVNITMQIEELDVFLKEVHNFISTTHIHLESGKITELTCQYSTDDLKYHFESTQGEILRNSIIISLAILLEREIDTFCDEFKKQKKLNVSHKDFRGDLLERFKFYSNKITYLGFDFSSETWQNIVGFYEIRNALVHNSGNLDNFSKKAVIENFIRRNNSFSIDEDRILISHQACLQSLKIIDDFFEQITELAFLQFPRE